MSVPPIGPARLPPSPADEGGAETRDKPVTTTAHTAASRGQKSSRINVPTYPYRDTTVGLWDLSRVSVGKGKCASGKRGGRNNNRRTRNLDEDRPAGRRGDAGFDDPKI